ncbi:MAG: alpha/beta fold hydrolase [Planctomycetota bacterium]
MAVESGVAGVVEEDVAFEREGLVLRGILARPVEGSPADGAVTIHGWGGSRTGPHRLFVTLGRALAFSGRLSLRFDLSGRGVSDGESRDASLDNMIDDAVAAIDLLRTKYMVRRVALVGICSGGNVAIGAAALRPREVSHVAALSTLPFAPQSASRGLGKAAGYLWEYLRKATSLAVWKRLLRGEASLRGAGRTLARALREDPEERRRKDSSRDIMAAFASFCSPVLFLYGGADPEAAEARAHFSAFARANGLSATFDAVEGSNHNFYSLPWAEAARTKICDFLARA